ncbi:SusD/RagB family nutrient-binding outer membrane lipoprotein [Bacteroides stercorirosoris]|uniref:SusD/RagB family nutrient-binding outer membrane lipoprotein n=1 Tax=Bacteroides stercorirosoris TaxID=871324 RepID=UPI0023F51FC4|nr:SusD/RagB family nutrient-binding outer membrane lipoprotein [Bacteroides stercorirosoris]
MKYNKFLTILLASGLLGIAVACTDNFESDNRNKTGFDSELQEYDFQKYLLKFEIIQTGIYYNYDWGEGKNWTFQIAQNLGQDMFSGYFHDFNQAFNDKNSVYALNDGWTSTHWSYNYSYIMPEVQKCEQINVDQPALLAVTQILKVELMHRVADCYGPLVYSKFGQEGDNVDDLKTAYTQFFADLENGITALQKFIKENPGVEPYKDADLLTPNKTLAEWVKFGNSLRLRLAMRVANVDKTLATEQARKSFTLGEFLEEPGEVIAVSTAGGYTNPLGEINKSWGEVFMGATMESVLTGYDDPRTAKYYDKASGQVITWKDDSGEHTLPQLFDYANTYKGVPQGTGLLSADQRYRECSKSTISQSTNAILMTAAEVWFLRAEAALRGISTESPKECYETGVRTSFNQWGAGGVDAYLQSSAIPANYKDPFDSRFDMTALITTTPNWADANGTEEQFEKIMTQKWLAMYPEGNEAWTEQRRTGYPKLFKVKVNNSGGAIDTDIMIRRLPYPSTLATSNPTQYSSLTRALGGADNGGTRLWWDAGKNNF